MDEDLRLGGPIDDLIDAKLRALITRATDPARIATALMAEEPGLDPAETLELAGEISVKARAFLLSLLQP